MASKLPREKGIGPADYRRLAAFRHSLRHFLAISETAAREAGITPQHHQALLTIKGAMRQEDITVGYLAEQLLLQPHSAAELVDRMVRCGLLVRTKSRTDRRFVILSPTPLDGAYQGTARCDSGRAHLGQSAQSGTFAPPARR